MSQPLKSFFFLVCVGDFKFCRFDKINMVKDTETQRSKFLYERTFFTEDNTNDRKNTYSLAIHNFIDFLKSPIFFISVNQCVRETQPCILILQRDLLAWNFLSIGIKSKCKL